MNNYSLASSFVTFIVFSGYICYFDHAVHETLFMSRQVVELFKDAMCLCAGPELKPVGIVVGINRCHNLHNFSA